MRSFHITPFVSPKCDSFERTLSVFIKKKILVTVMEEKFSVFRKVT